MFESLRAERLRALPDVAESFRALPSRPLLERTGSFFDVLHISASACFFSEHPIKRLAKSVKDRAPTYFLQPNLVLCLSKREAPRCPWGHEDVHSCCVLL